MNKDLLIKEELDKFDKQFGITIVTKNSDGSEDMVNEGRWAGCDGCTGNMAERIEHRTFLESSLSKMYEAGRKDCGCTYQY